MKYAFVAEHRSRFSVRTMCHCLRIHPSGFYAWLKNPLSERAKEDARQTELVRKAWKDSGKVYGYPLAGRQAKRRLVSLLAKDVAEIDVAFAAFKEEKIDVLLVGVGSLFASIRKKLIDLSNRLRLPTLYGIKVYERT